MNPSEAAWFYNATPDRCKCSCMPRRIYSLKKFSIKSGQSDKAAMLGAGGSACNLRALTTHWEGFASGSQLWSSDQYQNGVNLYTSALILLAAHLQISCQNRWLRCCTTLWLGTFGTENRSTHTQCVILLLKPLSISIPAPRLELHKQQPGFIFQLLNTPRGRKECKVE